MESPVAFGVLSSASSLSDGLDQSTNSARNAVRQVADQRGNKGLEQQHRGLSQMCADVNARYMSCVWTTTRRWQVCTDTAGRRVLWSRLRGKTL